MLLQYTRSVGKCFPHLSPELLRFVQETGSNAGSEYDDCLVQGEGEGQDKGQDLMDTGTVIPRRLWLWLLCRTGVASERRWSQLSASTLRRLAETVTGLVLKVDGK